MLHKQIRIINNAGQYVRAGEVYQASQARKGADWRLVAPDGAGTYVRWYVMRQALRGGAFIEI